MKTTDHLKMPELVSVSDPVIMSEAEIKAYRKLEKEYTLPLLHDDVTAANAAVLCGKLVQLASGCVYDDGGTPTIIHSRKLDALEDLLEAQNGKPVLVAYWYQHERERIKARFDVREIKTDKSLNRQWCSLNQQR